MDEEDSLIRQGLDIASHLEYMMQLEVQTYDDVSTEQALDKLISQMVQRFEKTFYGNIFFSED